MCIRYVFCGNFITKTNNWILFIPRPSLLSSGITTNDARERHELKKQPHQQVTAKAAGKQTGDTLWQGKAVKVLVPVPMETWPEPSSHRTEFARVSWVIKGCITWMIAWLGGVANHDMFWWLDRLDSDRHGGGGANPPLWSKYLENTRRTM